MRTKFEVPGNPQGKARARTFYNARLGRSQSVTPEKTVLYENLVKNCFMEQCELKFFNKEPLRMCITALFPIPKSTTKKDKALMAEWKLHPTKKPDADNIAKVICDALNGVAYGDDTQVVNLNVKKRYTDEEPKVIVHIEQLETNG